MVSEEAYRTLKVNNGLKEGDFRVLFDIKAQVDKITELHPMLNTGFIQRGPVKINGEFSKNEIFVLKVVLLDLYYINDGKKTGIVG